MMSRHIWLTSDTHFGHENILRFEPKRDLTFNPEGFKPCDIKQHDEGLMANILNTVTSGDILYILGDFGFGHPAYLKSLVQRLVKAGITVHLVKGNHDKNTVGQMLSWGFASVSESVTLKICKQQVLLCHYPYRWHWLKHLLFGKRNDNHKRPVDRGLWLLHGHTHSEKKPIKERMINVGVDCWGYKPLSLQAIEQIIQRGTK